MNEQTIRDIVRSEISAALADLLPSTTTAPAKAVPAPAKPEVRYRTTKQNETGRAKYDALWARLRKENPGVSGKDLAKAHRAELDACWPKGTRKTKAPKA